MIADRIPFFAPDTPHFGPALEFTPKRGEFADLKGPGVRARSAIFHFLQRRITVKWQKWSFLTFLRISELICLSARNSRHFARKVTALSHFCHFCLFCALFYPAIRGHGLEPSKTACFFAFCEKEISEMKFPFRRSSTPLFVCLRARSRAAPRTLRDAAPLPRRAK